MDVFAHTLWTNALFHIKYHKQRRMRYLAAFFGVAPDLVGFVPAFFYLVFSGSIFNRTVSSHFDSSHWTIDYAAEMYNYSHSLVIFATVTILVTLIGNLYKKYKKGELYTFWFFWPILGWALHILIDIPTHPDFYQTPLLFPLSDFRNTHGVSWAHPTFMLVNYSLLVLAYVALYIYQKRKNHQKYLKRKELDGALNKK